MWISIHILQESDRLFGKIDDFAPLTIGRGDFGERD